MVKSSQETLDAKLGLDLDSVFRVGTRLNTTAAALLLTCDAGALTGWNYPN